MTRNLRMAVVIAAVAAAACGKTRDEPRGLSAAAEEQRVLAADDAYAAAEVRRDEMTLRRYVDDQFVRNHDDGTTSGKEDFIVAVLRLELVNQTISERSVVVEGNMAIVLATTELSFDESGGPRPISRLRYTAVYVERDGEWRMLALQIQPRVSR